jgi:hypothetical protein
LTDKEDILMKRASLVALFGAGLLAMLAAPAGAQSAITEQEAHAIGVDAYLYFYPLLSMDITRKQFTNIEPGKEPVKGPMNMFINVPAYPPADFKGVVRSNFDTLYSSAWLSCRCSICGPMFSPRPVGGRQARNRPTPITTISLFWLRVPQLAAEILVP